mmetsp:Transcript_919/g.2797  ORF Transcript_919/g.2797 Transcript_919/m.2797 type:complete len:104 (-) Transcript_919:87-398(-)
MWLQSYIDHYTLPDWMKEAKRRGEQYLTHEQLLGKLDQFAELRRVSATSWTSRANELYKSLFFADVMKSSNAQIVNGGYTSQTQLTDMTFDLACVYPEPGAKK